MYVLKGGPRDGQLVDALPVGYEVIASGRGSAPVFETYVADVATWVYPRLVPADAQSSPGRERQHPHRGSRSR